MNSPAESCEMVSEQDRRQADGADCIPQAAVAAPSNSDRLHCPLCGNFVGPYGHCPFCGERIPGRLAIRVVKLIALLLATAGLGGIWWAARGIPIPTIAPSEALGTMNLAYVRLEGRVPRSITYDPDSGYLGFWVADETGEVHVNGYRDVTDVLLAEGRVPAIGDTVSVAGTLRIREDTVSLTLNVPEHLDLVRADAQPVPPGEITMLDEGLRVRVVGEVTDVKQPYDGLTLIDVRDQDGEITVAVDETTEMLSGDLPEIDPGQAITVEGAVTLYKTQPQISPAVVSDIQAVTATIPITPVIASRTISEITSEDEGRRVRVNAQVVMLEGLRGGVKATLDDGTAQIYLLLWDDLHQSLESPTAVDVGAQITVTGQVKLYEGALEILPERPTDVEIGSAAPPAPWVELGQLSALDAGRVVRIRGLLEEPQGFSAGVKVIIKDGTGEITLLLWSDLYKALAPKPQAGLQVEVIGVVDVYNSDLQLVPRSPFDWHVRVSEN